MKPTKPASAIHSAFVCGLAISLISFSAFAQAENSPVGVWKSLDDATGKPKALIRITETNGVLSGKIEKLFRSPSEDQHPICTKCEGADKNQPVIGLVILNGLTREPAPTAASQSGDAKETTYSGGTILDPANGKNYTSKLTLVEGSNMLRIRGYIGMPLFGRSQTWVRETAANGTN